MDQPGEVKPDSNAEKFSKSPVSESPNGMSVVVEDGRDRLNCGQTKRVDCSDSEICQLRDELVTK